MENTVTVKEFDALVNEGASLLHDAIKVAESNNIVRVKLNIPSTTNVDTAIRFSIAKKTIGMMVLYSIHTELIDTATGERLDGTEKSKTSSVLTITSEGKAITKPTVDAIIEKAVVEALYNYGLREEVVA